MFQQCQWIWGSECANADEYMDFHLSFTGKRNAQYCLYIACDSEYAIYDGSCLISFGQYPDYPNYRVYDRVPLSSVREGKNELRLTVWYQGVNFKTYIKKPAGVIFKITEDDQDILCSSAQIPSRRTLGYVPHLCRSISPQLGLTFAYDANNAEEPFSPTSYVVKGISKELYLRPVKKLNLMPRMDSKVIQQGGYILQGGEETKWKMQNAALAVRMVPGKTFGTSIRLLKHLTEDGIFFIVDLCRETSGFLEFEFTVPETCDVMIGWGEHLLDGRCRTAVRNFSCDYRAKAGHNKFIHPFRRLGCRYLQFFIACKEAEIFYAGIRETLYPVEVKDYPQKNWLRYRISQVCVNTLRQCMHEHYEDCPWREQGLYAMDSRNQMLCGYYAFGETQFPRACLELMSNGVREDGILSVCFPAGNDHPIPSFTLIYFIQIWEYFQYSHDFDFLKSKYTLLKNLIHTFLKRAREDGLISIFQEKKEYWNFYEWADGLNGSERWDYPVYDAPLNAFLSIALQYLANISDVLLQKQDAEAYRVQAMKINQALVATFYDAQTQLFRSFENRRQEEYSVLTNSLCVLCGAAKYVPVNRIQDILMQNKATPGTTVIPCTLSMNAFRFDALLKMDFEHFGPLILNEIDEIYMQMLEQGATSFWETLKGAEDFEGAGSLCHGWSAIPLYYYAILDGFC